MTYAITSNCIGCQRCVSACPTAAIQKDGAQARIDVNRCNQCVGSFSVPQCWASCPTSHGCIEALAAATTDYWENWFTTYTHVVQRLNKTANPKYWNRWFDRYAAMVKRLQKERSVTP
ncbi:MAG: 4Fe-4S dicluster domain-containing protein [Leptolyngbya sp. SIOISBB]|nr:4Fe-4S dicluster domain-containing protein [Leptolyngbya sp. SIOISBB]